MKTSETLHKAADLIEERGWIRGGGWPGDPTGGRLCLEGGIAAAVGITKPYSRWGDEDLSSFETCPAYAAVADYLEWSMSLYLWNDEQDDSDRVVEVLRAAALIEGAREDQEAAWATYAGLVSA